MDQQLKDVVAVITGGASGIGRATVRRFVGQGARVVIADLDGARAERLADEIRLSGGDVVATSCDVSRFGDVAAAVDLAVADYGRLDVMFNNAGIAGGRALLDHEPDIDYRPMIAVNQDGVYHGILAAGRRFRDQGTGGTIISTTSIYAEQAADFSLAYSASKAAVIALTRAAAYELAPFGVRAVSVMPGRVRTPIIDQFDDDALAVFADEQLRGQLTEADEVADVVAFLCSSAANAINGTVVRVEDGYGAFKQRLGELSFR